MGKFVDLDDFIEWFIARKTSVWGIFAFGITACDSGGRVVTTPDSQTWATIVLSTDGQLGEAEASTILRLLDVTIADNMLKQQLPGRLAYRIESSGKSYRARACRAKSGQLSTAEIIKQGEIEVTSEESDGETTRPATPQGLVERQVVEVELDAGGSDGDGCHN
ncbi:Uu.00g092470.m01.CDS01 [Anthostomella pinea]|uniref:Uu.00g092470.m01.CDS01 n=1 Tax=Anthostomella pinea TaxID=933095 RepID=A0AAI8VN92_9PEZI|nr:Uu.00g092470.m01.CDS01 [Anthostomella pinea]